MPISRRLDLEEEFEKSDSPWIKEESCRREKEATEAIPEKQRLLFPLIGIKKQGFWVQMGLGQSTQNGPRFISSSKYQTLIL